MRIVPANQATWPDLQAVFGQRGQGHQCQCQRYKLAERESFGSAPVEERAHRLRAQTDCGRPRAASTSGLVGYLGEVPDGWCAVEPRCAYVGLVRVFTVPWVGRDEDRDDPTVWAITCLFARAGYRRRGVCTALAGAAVEFARDRGASAVEAYPMTTTQARPAELHVGTVAMFRAAGLTERSRPTKRRAVLRRDFAG